VKDISENEKQKVELWASAVQKKASLVKLTKELFEEIKEGELKKAELFGEAMKELSTGTDVSQGSGMAFILEVLQDNTTVPVILTDENDKIVIQRNLDSARAGDSVYLERELELMKSVYPPVEIVYYKDQKQRLYHKDSKVFNDIKLVF